MSPPVQPVASDEKLPKSVDVAVIGAGIAGCTAAYAKLMLAWGLGCLGERLRSIDWTTRARKALAQASGPGVDPAAHAVLGGLFADRVRGVQDGRPPAGGIPADLLPRYDALPPLARYAVDRLRDHSRILEPLREGVALRGLDVRLVRGTDRLGERRVMAVCLWVYGLGALVPAVTQHVAILPVVVLVALAAVSLMTLPYALLMNLLPESDHGAGAALFAVSRGIEPGICTRRSDSPVRLGIEPIRPLV